MHNKFILNLKFTEVKYPVMINLFVCDKLALFGTILIVDANYMHNQ